MQHHFKEDIQMFEQVNEVLEKLRPYLQRDGGDVELIQSSSFGCMRRLSECHHYFKSWH